MERSPWLVLPIILMAAGCHPVFRFVMRLPMKQEEEMEGYEVSFQTLNLS